ncbi:MAG: hypothetical protein J7K94_04635 [Dehalococcoidia bacterium]|nr:hypothetical protein [Dehalococcoidia bacterium]
MAKGYSPKKLCSASGKYLRGLFTFEKSPEGSRKKKEVLALMGAFCALLAAAFAVGISDNIPGIVLCFLATIALVLLPVRTWRKAKRFLFLMGAAVVGFFIFVLLHNAFYALAVLTSNIAALRHLMEAIHVACFIIAIFICPAAFLVGAAGSVVQAITGLRKRAKE